MITGFSCSETFLLKNLKKWSSTNLNHLQIKLLYTVSMHLKQMIFPLQKCKVLRKNYSYMITGFSCPENKKMDFSQTAINV
jgi:hypothetical protein